MSRAWLAIGFLLCSDAASALSTDPATVRPALPGSTAPQTTLEDIDGKRIALADALGGKPAVLVFYRGGWCPFCNMQLSELRKLAPDLRAQGVQLIAISPDRPAKMRETLDTHALDYTLLSDHTAEAIKAFGIAFEVDAQTLEKYASYGIDLEEASGAQHHALPVPSVFVIDAQGIVQFGYSNPDYRTRVPERLIRAAVEAVLKGETGKPVR
jgi:peroxiredoxin